MITTKTIMISALIATAAFAAPPVIVQRQADQQARIAQGVRTGSLTASETASIERRQAALAREVRHDRLDGGGLSLAERAKIQRQQNGLSRQVYGLKHNGRSR